MSKDSETDGEATAGLPELRGALEAIPGCLGPEAARTESGKEVIFAWFEDKQAVLRWYHSQIHKRTRRGAFRDFAPRGPLKDVTEVDGPILVMPTLTPTEPAPAAAVTLPI